jgi:hypothetical protein
MKKMLLFLMLTFASVASFAHSYGSLFWRSCTAIYEVTYVTENGDFIRSETYMATADTCAEAIAKVRNEARPYILN